MNNCILFGFKGSGKTYWGQQFAEAHGKTFIDTDQVVISLYGEPMTCREITLEIGEEAFRVLEQKAIHSLKEVTNAVIALGGGAILSPVNQYVLSSLGRLIYLKASYDTLKKRVVVDPLPSFLDPQNPEGSFKIHYHRRLPLYGAIPAQIIDVDAHDVLHQFKEIITHGK